MLDARPGRALFDLQRDSLTAADLETEGLITGVEPTRARTIAIVGLGYVGLPTALTFCAGSSLVIGVDASQSRLDAIRERRVDILPADKVRLERALSGSQLSLTSNAETIGAADAVIVCVPTPVDAHLVPDLSALRAACAGVVAHAHKGQLLILTSTSYVGTTRDLLIAPLEARGLRVGRDIFVAFSPERINPGSADFTQHEVPRVVGGATAACATRAADVLGRASANVHAVSSPEAAELTKLFENTFRAVNLALANEVSDVARALDLEIAEVIAAASTKPYGFMPFHPGPGVGGHCIPCDPHYLLWQLRARRVNAPLIERAMMSIAERPSHVVERARAILAAASKNFVGARVLVVGVAYKPGVEDVRESPALEIIAALRAEGAHVAFTDALVPHVRLQDGATLHSVPEPSELPTDLVIVHTLHPGADHKWVSRHGRVLDTTYRLEGVPHRAVL